jgi:8-oxo-dGTP pyrophosphatase MutT (NUDIX family)
MGRRQKSAVFMPDVFVFPGGRVEPADYCAPCAANLSRQAGTKLLKRVKGQARPARARALAVAALREAEEEAGARLRGRRPSRGPRLDLLRPIARAVTPPRQRRRFDTRFFAIDAGHMAFSDSGDGELTRLSWFSFDEARAAPLHVVTLSVLGDLERRIRDGGWEDPALPLPFYFKRGACFARILL